MTKPQGPMRFQIGDRVSREVSIGQESRRRVGTVTAVHHTEPGTSGYCQWLYFVKWDGEERSGVLGYLENGLRKED